MVKHKSVNSTIAINKKASHDYFIEERFEAGIVLTGWEAKSLRAGRCQLNDSHVIFRKGEAWLLGAHITPLSTVSTHVVAEPTRTRKLLLKQKELNKLFGSVERKGYTVIPLRLYWKKQLVKVEIALARGKKQYDKRASIKEKEWQREKARLLKSKN